MGRKRKMDDDDVVVFLVLTLVCAVDIIKNSNVKKKKDLDEGVASGKGFESSLCQYPPRITFK